MNASPFTSTSRRRTVNGRDRFVGGSHDLTPDTPLGPSFLLGAGTGVLLGVFTSLSPVIAIVALGLVLVVTAIGMRSDAKASRSVFLGATLIGSGVVLGLGAANTIGACVNTEDFCGGANVWPLAAFAVLAIAAGTLAVLAAWIRRPRPSE
jgi:hypothetical protein